MIATIPDPVPADADLRRFERTWFDSQTMRSIELNILMRQEPHVFAALMQIHTSCTTERGCGIADNDAALAYAAGFHLDPDLWASMAATVREHLVRGATSGLLYVRWFVRDLIEAWRVKWKNIQQTSAAREKRQRNAGMEREMEEAMAHAESEPTVSQEEEWVTPSDPQEAGVEPEDSGVSGQSEDDLSPTHPSGANAESDAQSDSAANPSVARSSVGSPMAKEDGAVDSGGIGDAPQSAPQRAAAAVLARARSALAWAEGVASRRPSDAAEANLHHCQQVWAEAQRAYEAAMGHSGDAPGDC